MPDRDFTPSDGELIAYDRGLLPDDRIDVVTGWLEKHPEGEERLQRLTELHRDYAIEALRRTGGIDAELAQLRDVTTGIINRGLAPAPPAATVIVVPKMIRDYCLQGKLGEGGMGTVYRARHSRLQRDVAIKFLPGRLVADPDFRARFEREMAVIGQLDHPNLIRAHDAGIEGDHLFLVMDLLDGQDLQKLVEQSGPLPVADACEAVRQAALGLHHAHEHGIIHRDVKPANLFLTRSGIVKVIDLGLARPADQRLSANMLSSVNTVMGTPEFMAPEQWRNRDIGPLTDVYGLGCVLFFLLSGRTPFVRQEGQTWVDVLEAQRQAPPDLHELRPEVPAELAALVTRMLAKSPHSRPISAAAVADLLAPFAAGNALADTLAPQPCRPRTKSALGSPKTTWRRTRWIAAAALLLLAMLSGSIWYWSRPDKTPDLPGGQALGERSLLLTGVDNVELANTVGMIDLNGTFTVEMWVKFGKGVQYFVGDEIWPNDSLPNIKRSYGWVLRIEEENGKRLNFTAAGITQEWIGWYGDVVEPDDRWHHIAVSKDAKLLRVFLDGKTYLSKETKDLKLVNCPTNLFLGLRTLRPIPALSDCSFKAFRVSARHLYANDFTPTAEFNKTDDTLVLLDFRAGKGQSVPDLSGKGHHGRINGGYWSSPEPAK